MANGKSKTRRQLAANCGKGNRKVLRRYGEITNENIRLTDLHNLVLLLRNNIALHSIQQRNETSQVSIKRIY